MNNKELKKEEQPLVLIVDDIEDVRKLLKTLLRSLGFKQIHEAANGREAFRILESQDEIDKIMKRHIKLVLCDINMPKMDGMKFLKELKKRKEFDDVAVIMVTGEATKETIVQAGELGADGFILKPYTQKIFIEKITKALERKGELK